MYGSGDLEMATSFRMYAVTFLPHLITFIRRTLFDSEVSRRKYILGSLEVNKASQNREIKTWTNTEKVIVAFEYSKS